MKNHRPGCRKSAWLLVGLALAACLPAAPMRSAAADVIYVDDSAPPPPAGANDGSSWENAFLDLQDALAVAQSGDEVRVAQGLYRPGPLESPRSETFSLGHGIVLQGGYAGFGAMDPDALDPALFVSALSGDILGDDVPTLPPDFGTYADNALHVVTVGPGVSAIIRGVTVRGGSADATREPDGRGGGILAIGADLHVHDVILEANRATWLGGGAAFGGDDAQPGALSMVGCVIRHNRVTYVGVCKGGGVSVSAPASISNCLFEFNVAGGAGSGGGLDASNASLTACTFRDNHAGEDAGALELDDGTMIDCLLLQNTAGWGGGAMLSSGTIVALNCAFLGNRANVNGGAVGHDDGTFTAVNCLFSGNESIIDSGGAITNGDIAYLINCTVVGNSTGDHFGPARGAIHTGGGHTEIRNCLVWANDSAGDQSEATQVSPASGDMTIADSTIFGWTGSLGGVNNNGLDPQFIDAHGPDSVFGTIDDNPRLDSNSPARDAGDSAALPADESDLDGDGNMAEPVPVDLDGRRRVVGSAVDRGAFEFQTCLADFVPLTDQGDGEVNVEELIEVIASWGPCLQPCPPVFGCPADIVPNCAVDVDDLIAVILGWGVCD
jgi:hypothetical protein